MAEVDRDPRGGYDFWDSFIEGHLDANDGMLGALAEVVGDSPLVDEAPKALNAGPPSGQAEEELDEDGLPPHLEPVDITEGLTEEQVEELARRATFINPKLLGYNGRASVLGIEVSNQLRDLLIDAWDHYQDPHECEGSIRLLDRILEQLISAFHVARGRTEGDD